jgi:hypothetical protein
MMLLCWFSGNWTTTVVGQANRSLAPLLGPRDTLGFCGRRSLRSRENHITRGILSVVALDSVSEIVSDRLDGWPQYRLCLTARRSCGMNVQISV